MDFTFQNRLSDSPMVAWVWQTQSAQASRFISQAASHWEMVVTTHQGKTSITVRGPETVASAADCPADAEFFGIVFNLGTYMPQLPLGTIMNRQDKTLPNTSDHTFWLQGASWEYPTFENADTFVQRLTHSGLLVHDPVVNAVLQNHPLTMSPRSVQRRFLHVTGVTHKTIQQIERARRATALLVQGVPILDVAFETGYYDQAHMTNALTRFMGQTPAQIAKAIALAQAP